MTFDRVNWKCQHCKDLALENCLLIGSRFCTLLLQPRLSLMDKPHSFTLHRGTRQGCPLCPSIDTIFIEPLAAAICQNIYTEGIKTPKTHHQISLYADDILLFRQNPHSSLKDTLQLIESFSNTFDYSINWNKSSILPPHYNSWNVAAHKPPIPLCTDQITYLGISVSCRLSELFIIYYLEQWSEIESDHRWMNLPRTILGRIATVYMTILPKINFLFSIIPPQPTLTLLKSLDSNISKFYRKNKTPQIKLATLVMPKT